MERNIRYWFVEKSKKQLQIKEEMPTIFMDLLKVFDSINQGIF